MRYQAKARSLGPISNALLLALMVAVLGLLYLTQITKTSSYSYVLSDLDGRREELLEENEALQVEAARLQAIERVQNSEVAKQLEDAQTVQFVGN